MRRTLAAVGLALLSLGSRPAESAGLPECIAGLKAMLQDAGPRRGVAFRWLAVVPLVRAGAGAAAAPAPVLPEAGLRWQASPRPGAPSRVSLRPTARPVPGRLVAAGTLLEGDPDERLSLVPTLLPDENPVLLDAVVLDPHESARAAGRPGGDVGPLPPIEFRRSAFAGAQAAAMNDLLRIEAHLLGGAPGADHVALGGLLAALPERVGPARAALSPLADAYGGDVVGHAVFLGNRLVEVVLAGSPATYRSVLTAEQRAIALSLVAWEELYGRDGPLVPEVDWAATLKETARVLKALGDPSIRAERRDEPRAAAGDVWRVKAATRPGRLAAEVGWLLSDPTGRAIWFEAWPEAAVGPLPEASPEPGSASPGEDDEDRKHGWIGPEYLERKIQQLEALNESGALTQRIEALKRLLDSFSRRRGE